MQSLNCRLGSLLLPLTLIVACGQKGPLYLPADESAIYSPVPEQTSDSDKNDQDEAPKKIRK
ncbi:uncharacterized protein METZ01_LOCUS327785 [marine metagenome]|jgi:predicted small lipoprotein YifL|uniref:Lipoprotein n=1 Tax=marine metagenome TaxID=408172 RepID=A0A382PSG1_9ZZZZ